MPRLLATPWWFAIVAQCLEHTFGSGNEWPCDRCSGRRQVHAGADDDETLRQFDGESLLNFMMRSIEADVVRILPDKNRNSYSAITPGCA
jgi:hypothetical protein